jgi:hypothetical protein
MRMRRIPTAPQDWRIALFLGNFDDRLLFDELPLFSSAYSGRPVQIVPESVGYFYDLDDDFSVDELGLWFVDVIV